MSDALAARIIEQAPDRRTSLARPLDAEEMP